MKRILIALAVLGSLVGTSLSASADEDHRDHDWHDSYWHHNHYGYWHGKRGYWRYREHHYEFVRIGPLTIQTGR